MTLKNDIADQVKGIFAETWTKTKATVVPEPGKLALGNDARTFDSATILYADLAGSTAMVDSHEKFFAAEV